MLEHSPQEEAGGVEHAVQSGQAVRPLASLVHSEKHVLAQAPQLRQLLFELLGGSRVALLIHPLGRLSQFGGDLLLLLLRQHQLIILLVQFVLRKSTLV